MGRNFPTPFSYFSLRNLPLMFQVKALTRHAANTARYFRDPRLQAAFSFQNMYLGLSPYEAPATFSLLQYTELADGVWFPKGGMYTVIWSLAGIAEGLGVRFRYSSPAARINVDGGRATGVTLEGGERLKPTWWCPTPTSPTPTPNCCHRSRPQGRMQGMKYTSSALIFYWAVKGERSSELLHHNVFLADHRYRELFDSIFRGLSLPEEPSFYVCAPTRTEPGFRAARGRQPDGARAGGTPVECGMWNAECGPRSTCRIPHSELRERARQAVLLRLERDRA